MNVLRKIILGTLQKIEKRGEVFVLSPTIGDIATEVFSIWKIIRQQWIPPQKGYASSLKKWFSNNLFVCDERF